MSSPKAEGEFSLNESRKGKAQESLVMRLLWMVVISVMLSLAQTVLTFVTIIQFMIMLASGRQPNERLADFGTTLGIWIAKALAIQIPKVVPKSAKRSLGCRPEASMIINWMIVTKVRTVCARLNITEMTTIQSSRITRLSCALPFRDSLRENSPSAFGLLIVETPF